MAVRGPELELGVPAGSQSGKVILASRVQVDGGDRLSVAAIEALRQANHRRQRLDRPTQRAAQIAVALMRLFRRCLPVIPRDERQNLDLLRREASQVAVLD